MGDPTQYLPPSLDKETLLEFARSLGLPTPIGVRALIVIAEYHPIYLLSFSAEDASETSPKLEALDGGNGSVDLVLRVSGSHLPHIKTENEVAVMTWVRQHTSIPIPEIIRFDATTKNSLGYEFTLLTRSPSIGLHEVYDQLSVEQLTVIVDQILDIVLQMHQKSWSGVSGQVLSPSTAETGASAQVISRLILDETFWQAPDIVTYFPASYTAYIVALVRVYQHAIRVHTFLEARRDLLPRLDAWVDDLHVANIMYDPTAARVTAILDWEFSGAFLWNGQRNAQAVEEQKRVRALFDERCRIRGVDLLLETEPRFSLQESMQDAIGYLRAIFGVCPRGEKADKVGEWRAILEPSLEIFKV
ncbi:hypothetical protein BDV37DRAFT_270103 [Aspergillus pseudonomiae]|uniref:Aminoglycoside phosphotransferase domain-containing protein n=1 Tax=Aspergillus pseudonomiae TaxID=1506151 RepID=A0A5N7DIM9_9EURO|nr:uncharacterized protein BDV37DRAFT_270103 [Aspergillus pseudonomiae]KAE8406194.1 hypothetical protein BDV37DRAFT_270103 [Aspergillus pseudonomiae]